MINNFKSMKISEIRKILLKRGFKVSRLNRNKINKDLKKYLFNCRF